MTRRLGRRRRQRSPAPISSYGACEQAPSLREPSFHERPMIDRLEALFHPEMRRKLGGWYHTPMRDFEAWLPRHQLDLRQPYRAYQHETLLRPCDAHSAAEAEQPRINYGRACLLQDLSAESLLPGFIALWTASWPAPSFAIVADQHDTTIGGHAESIRPMGDTIRSRSRREPGDQPIAPVRVNRELLAVARYGVSQHCHPHCDQSRWAGGRDQRHVPGRQTDKSLMIFLLRRTSPKYG